MALPPHVLRAKILAERQGSTKRTHDEAGLSNGNGIADTNAFQTFIPAKARVLGPTVGVPSNPRILANSNNVHDKMKNLFRLLSNNKALAVDENSLIVNETTS